MSGRDFPEPLMPKLMYLSIDGTEENWDASEEDLQEYLIKQSGPDIRVKFTDGQYLPEGCSECEAVLTVSGDFEIENRQDDGGITRFYMKPRTRITIVCEGESRMSEVIDLDSRKMCNERLEEIVVALAESKYE